MVHDTMNGYIVNCTPQCKRARISLPHLRLEIAVEEEVGRHLLVLVTREVRLDDRFPREPKGFQLEYKHRQYRHNKHAEVSTYPLNGSPLLRRDMDDLRAGRNRTGLFVVPKVRTKDLRQRLRVLREQLGEARVRLRELLDERLRERGVLHHDLTQLLDLRVVHERGEVRAAPSTCSSRGTRTKTCTETRTEACTKTGNACATTGRVVVLLLLLSELEEVLWLGRGLCRNSRNSWGYRRCSGLSSGCGRLSSGSRRRGLFSGLIKVCGDTLIMDRISIYNKCQYYALTLKRYSTARSGLLKLARRARMTCSRSKPISIMFWIVD